MARPRPDLPPPEVLRALIDARGLLALHVTPGARAEGLEIVEGALFAKVRARAEGGKANEATRNILARALGMAPSRIELLRGATARQKQFAVAVAAPAGPT